MKVALLGGGGFRTPLTFAALQRANLRLDLHELALYDLDASRLATMCRVLQAMQSSTRDSSLKISPTTELDIALRDASYILCAIRVGGLRARALDERVAISAGLVGQETVGAGGLSLLMRSVSVVTTIAQQAVRAAPNAWFINFTNPVGAISGILRDTLGDRVIGVCDTPSELTRRIATLLDEPLDALAFDYFGLNHLGWLRGICHSGCNLLPELLNDNALLSRLDEAHLFGVDCLRQYGLIPIEYLTYYYFPERHLTAVAEAGESRAEYLLCQQEQFYEEAATRTADPLTLWRTARAERDRSYLSDASPGAVARHAPSAETDGYATVAVTVLEALATNTPATAIVDVANGRTLPFLPRHATVEIPCTIDRTGPSPSQVHSVPEHASNLMQRVHTAEQAAIDAVRARSRTDAIAAFASHPLVGSTSAAEHVFTAYLQHQPQLAAAFA